MPQADKKVFLNTFLLPWCISGAGRYTSFTTNLNDIPYLGSLPFTVGEVKTFDLSEHIDDSTKEVLVYVYVTMLNSVGPIERGFYEIYTEDDDGNKYGQFMNVVFTNDDFVTSSDNLWLPIFSRKEFKVQIPNTYSIDVVQEAVYHPEPTFRSLEDGMRAYVSTEEEDKMFADAYLLGKK